MTFNIQIFLDILVSIMGFIVIFNSISYEEKVENL